MRKERKIIQIFDDEYEDWELKLLMASVCIGTAICIVADFIGWFI